MKIKSINKIQSTSKKYDIEVRKNHNFFANGILVHNCNMYSDRIHARSLETDFHESRTWVRALWGNIKHEIQDGWRICGENMFAEHSIHYNNLETYFYVFSIWNETNDCLSWDETF